MVNVHRLVRNRLCARRLVYSHRDVANSGSVGELVPAWQPRRAGWRLCRTSRPVSRLPDSHPVDLSAKLAGRAPPDLVAGAPTRLSNCGEADASAG